MVIKYEITPDDLEKYYLDFAKGMSVYTVYTVILVLLVVLFMLADMILATVAIGYNDGSVKVESFNVLPRFIITVVICFFVWLILKLQGKSAMSKVMNVTGKNGQFCEHTITLDDAGFTEQTEVNRNFHSWEGVDKITETGHNVVIHVRLGAEYFVPKKSFSGVDEITAFIDAVNTHLRRTRGNLAV